MNCYVLRKIITKIDHMAAGPDNASSLNPRIHGY